MGMVADVRLVTATRGEVYEPSDDSFALVDALEAAAPDWLGSPPRILLEIGVGSGYVSAALHALAVAAGCRSPALLAVDVSPPATRDAASTLAAHGCKGGVDLLLADLGRPLLPRLEGAVDVVAFNPPYVPTPDDEVTRGGLAAAWAGGTRGRAVLDRAVPVICRLLAPGGEAFVVTVRDNDPDDVLRLFAAHGVPGAVALERAADEERLAVLRCRKPKQ